MMNIVVKTGFFSFCWFATISILSSHSLAQQAMHLPRDPDLSADGKRMVFAWRGDIWLANTAGGAPRQLTATPDRESSPKFSPDNKRIAFVSTRAGQRGQVFVMPVSGGEPKQLTFHSEGCDLLQWIDDGESLLISASRDHYWRDAARHFRISATPHSPEKLVFDSAGENGRFDSAGKRMLFTREGTQWWRKGYRGSQASQIWMFETAENRFTKISSDETGAMAPLWGPEGDTFYYVAGASGAFNIYRGSVAGGEAKQLTTFDDDSVVMPCISADGKTMVFRHLFDFYSMDLETESAPKKIRLVCRADLAVSPVVNTVLDNATEVAFSSDALEIAFVSGGDVWVMDTILREPKQVTRTPEEESSLVFAPDDNSLMFVSDAEGQSDIWQARRTDEEKYWWLNNEFSLQRVTNDAEIESSLQVSPSGDHIAFVKGRGDLWLMKIDGTDRRRFLESWDAPSFDWSPDGKWLTWSVSDNNFNSDVFVAPIDGSRSPLNLSRHPDNDTGPVWSPDGKIVAFTGRRLGEERDIWFVYLQKSEDEVGERDRKLKEALEKLEKERKKSQKPKTTAEAPTTTGSASGDEPPAEIKTGKSEGGKADSLSGDAKPDEKSDDRKKVEIVVDEEGIGDRIRRVSIPNTGESGLFWSPDSKKLAFNANIDGKPGVYTIEFPSDLTPKLLSPQAGRQASWIEKGNQILWLKGGSPESFVPGGKTETYSFRALSQVDVAAHQAAGFDLAWRAMRDNFYDGNLNNRNWDEIRRKYREAAANAADSAAFADVVNLMLGELNGSHLGFSASDRGSSSSANAWNDSTAHFGLRFDSDFRGPGLKVRDVIYRSPAWQEQSRIQPGEIVLSIDNQVVDPAMDLTQVLNGPLPRDVLLKVQNAEGEAREITIRPTTFGAVRSLLYEHWVKGNQQKVLDASQNRFGYIHIQGMNFPSFYDFERDLFAVADGKDGLIIDVRENGGGSTADHLLTILTQPQHAITVPRGGGPGYPHDRIVYAPWNKPIVVLCNQNSFSNAEIFSHAVKTLKRGRLVGVTTAGGVISTGGTSIMDLGFLRMPFRGWFLIGDGEDMELNGAVPDFMIWPEPGEFATGTDKQLDKAISVLDEDVAEWKAQKRPELKKASERPGRKTETGS